jgi:hypothetical protein
MDDMTDDDSNIDDLALALALRRLDEVSVVPPPEPAREAALMAAFDAAHAAGRGSDLSERRASKGRRAYWGMAALATAAALLIAVGIAPTSTGRPAPSGGSQATHKPPSSSRGVQTVPPPSEFVMVPGAMALPEIESGSLVRIDLPVSALPALGVMPPSGAVARVKADLILGQDGLPRAVRLVN